MTNPTLIVGAGMAGLLAAHAWPTTPVIDAAPGPKQAHKALLRFRTLAVSQLTGIEFTPVTVRKGIFSNYKFVAPNIRNCNQYAEKVVGCVVGRSIWNVDPAERYVAPETFYEQLLEAVQSRVTFNAPYAPLGKHNPVVSTAPLPAILGHHPVSADSSANVYKGNPIRVRRWRIPGANVHQTIYFPDPTTPLYRASICGDLLIAEEMVEDAPYKYDYVVDAKELVAYAFGINIAELNVNRIDESVQSLGKLQDLAAGVRKQILYQLTQEHNVYTLGRFATWRNILLDDVVGDIGVIKKIMRADAYDFRKISL